jgi:cytoskeletal protein CcmA (bactofilin family)
MPEPDIRPVTPFPSGGPEDPPLTVLSERDAFEGRVEMKGDGHVMGEFRGQIECGGELLIGPDAQVNASVRTHHLTISGLVAGNVVVTGRLKITATGQLRGDADVATLIVQEGGVHYGHLRVHPEGVPENASSTEPAAGPARDAGGTLGGPVDRFKRLWGDRF